MSLIGGIMSNILSNKPNQTANSGALQALANSRPSQKMSYNTANGLSPNANNPTLPAYGSMGVKANAPTTSTPSNTIAPKYTASAPSTTTLYMKSNGQPQQVNNSDVNAYLSSGNWANTPNSSNNTNNSNPNITKVDPTSNPNPYDPYGSSVSQLQHSVQNNQDITNRSQGILNGLAANIGQLRSQAANQEQAYNTGMILPRAQGLAQNTAQTEAAQEQALNSQVANQLAGTGQALTGQAQTQAGLQSVASLTAPQANAAYFGSPFTGGVSGQGAGTMQSALANAVQYIKNGATVSDALSLSGLNNFGLVGQNAISNYLNQNGVGGTSGFNPTAQNTISQTNAQIGAQNQTTAATLSTQLQQFQNLGDTATNFLTNNLGINPTQLPYVNEKIGTYMANVKNPAAQTAYNLVTNDIKGLETAILGSYGNTTPSQSVSAVLSTDPSTLQVNQLKPWIEMLQNLGSSRLAPLQSTAASAYGAGSSAYSGTPTSANTNAPTIPDATPQITAQQGNEALGGLGIGAVTSAGKGLGGDIISFIIGKLGLL